MALTVVALLLAACGDSDDTSSASPPSDNGGSSSDGDYTFPELSGSDLIFVDYGGQSSEVMAEAFTRPFAEGTGATVVHDSPFDPAKMKAQVDAGNVTWDIVNGDPLIALRFCEDGLLEKLDSSILDGIAPQYHAGECVLPINVYASVLAYDTEVLGDNPPTGWADFFDVEKYPGKRGMWSSPALHQLEIALLADGVAPEDLYPLDLDRAIAKLDSIKEHIIFYDSFAQASEQMHSKAVVMSDLPAQRGKIAAEEGASFAPVWNQSFLAWEAYGIPKGSTNVDAATELLRYMATPEVQSRVAVPLGVAPTTTDTSFLSDLDDESLTWLPAGDNIANAVTVSPEWWAEHYDEAVERFSSWTAG